MRRKKLMKEVYAEVYNESASFETDNVGADLAYLLGAILNKNFCAWPSDTPFMRILHQCFAVGHPVWDYIRIET